MAVVLKEVVAPAAEFLFTKVLPEAIGVAIVVVDRISGRIAAFVSALQTAWERSQTFRSVVVQVFNAVRSTITTAIDVVEKALDGFKAVLGTIESAINRIASAARNAASAIQRLINLAPSLPGIPSIDVPFFGGGRAQGGPVTRGVPYMVGEKGPELFVPKSSGSIMPNSAMTIPQVAKGGGASGGNVYNISFPNYVGDHHELESAVVSALARRQNRSGWGGV